MFSPCVGTQSVPDGSHGAELTGILSSFPATVSWQARRPGGSACGAQRRAEEEAPGALRTPQHSAPLLTTKGSSGPLPGSSGPGASKSSTGSH